MTTQDEDLTPTWEEAELLRRGEIVNRQQRQIKKLEAELVRRRMMVSRQKRQIRKLEEQIYNRYRFDY